MAKDWTGNSKSVHATLGAKNCAIEKREQNDYYATEPKATKLLLEVEAFSPYIWECACGEGHISEVLKNAGYILSQEKSRSGAGTSKAADVKVQAKYSADERKCQDGISKEKDKM